MATKTTNFFGNIVVIFFLSRLVLTLVGLLSLFYFPSARRLFSMTDLNYHKPQPAFLEIWTRWDSEWYLLIADKGYNSYDHFREYGHGKYLPQDIAKFFPAYPIAIRYLSVLTRNPILSGLLISNIAALLFLYFFYQISSSLFGEEAALGSCVFYILFPTSFFLSAVYSESLFLAAVTGAFYSLEKRRLIPAIPAIALAVLTRPHAVLALPALLWLAVRRMPEKRIVATSAILLSAAIPAAAFLFYIDRIFGSPIWIADSQRYWRGEMRYPLYALVRFAQSHIALHGQHNSLIDFGVAILNLLVLALSIRKIPGPYYLYSMLAVLFPLSSSLFSYSRLCLINFPFFLFLGNRLTGRWAFSVQVTFAMLLTFFMAAFANWFWVG